MLSVTYVSVTFSNVLFLVFCRFNKCDKKTKCTEMVICTFKNAIDQIVVFVALAECFSPKIFSTPRSDKFGKRACCVSFSMLVLPRLLAGSRPKKTWSFLPFTAITFRYLRLRNLSWKVLKQGFAAFINQTEPPQWCLWIKFVCNLICIALQMWPSSQKHARSWPDSARQSQWPGVIWPPPPS